MSWGHTCCNNMFIVVVFIGVVVRCSHVNSESSIGCLFSQELCDKREWCFDDNVFGRCLSAYEPIDETNFYRYDLQKDMLKRLEHEMRRLFRAGYKWGHAYTQCVLQNLLYTHRFGLDYNPSLCKGETGLDETLDFLKTNAKDLAVIHFSPSQINKHADFADEWFIPPRHSEKSRQPQFFGNNKKFPQVHSRSSSNDGGGHEKFKRLNLDFSESDLTEQQLEDLLQLLNAQELQEAVQQENADSNGSWNEDAEKDFSDSLLNKMLPEDLENLQALLESDAPIISDENSVNDFYTPPTWRPVAHTAQRLLVPSGSDSLRTTSAEIDGYEDELMDRSNAIDNNYWGSGFKRLHRYDVKKPGPNFMTNLDDLDSTEAVVNEQLQQAQLFKMLEDMVYKQQEEPQNETATVLDQDLTADGMVNSERGEAETINVGGNLKENSAEAEMEARSAVEPSKRKQDDSPKGKVVVSPSLYGAQPHVLSRNQEDLDIVDTSYAYITVDSGFTNWNEGKEFVTALEKLVQAPHGAFTTIRVEQEQVTFRVNPKSAGMNASTVASKAESLKSELHEITGKTLVSAGIGNQVKISVLNLDNDKTLFIITFVVCGCITGILIAVAVITVIRRHARSREKLQSLGRPESEASHDYQDLCRQRMANKSNEKPEPIHAAQRVTSLSRESEATVRSPSSRSSTSSWSEEPVTSNMDISTGHMVLSYMEDHLKNKDRLEQEWVALCAYEAEPCNTIAATDPENMKKNRYADVLPYDHARVVLNDLTNIDGSDYINASTITDHDPRNPAYIATQGPLPHTAADFWQMVWEQGSVVIVTLTRLVENGVAMSHRYWPEEGSELYHIYEVHLVSEHIWCDDYLVRSFYLKNLKTGETRTVTQFHFLSWPDNGVPVSVKALLDFRRKVNKSYRGRSCPIVVHCSDGSGRTGTYFLIDMVLNRMAKGAKEIDIAATLEHIRDQRSLMVKTKGQFEFALMAVAEEVHAILKALPQ